MSYSIYLWFMKYCYLLIKCDQIIIIHHADMKYAQIGLLLHSATD